MLATLGPDKLYIWWSSLWAAIMRGFGLAAMIYWVDTLGLGAFQLVILGTALEAGVLVAEIPTGVVADTRSRKLSLVIAHLIVGAGMVATGLTSTYWILIVAQVLWGVGWTFKSGADVAWITDELDNQAESDRCIARAAQWAQIGSIGGILVAGLLGALTSYTTAIVVFGVLQVLLGAGVALLFTEHEFTKAEGETWSQALQILKQGVALVRSERIILGVFLTTILIDMGSEAIDRLSIKRLDTLGFPDSADPIVWLMIINICAYALAAVFLKGVALRIGGEGAPRKLYASGILIAIVGIGLLVSAPSLAFGAAGALLYRSVSWSVFPVVGAVWVNRRATKQIRATLQSFLGQAGSLGEATGGIVLGAVAQRFDLPLAFTGSALLFGLALVVVLRNRDVAVDELSAEPA